MSALFLLYANIHIGVNFHRKGRAMNFSDLPLIKPLLRAVEEMGYTVPTPIQQQAIPPTLEGRDLLGCA